jgi:hypothetical protein
VATRVDNVGHVAIFLMVKGARTMVSIEYEQALEASREASAKFREAQNDYRAKRIGDEAFLKARADYKKSEAAFDAAYAAEEAREAGAVSP